MACFVYRQAENILSKLPGQNHQENCPIFLKNMAYTMLTLKAILLDAEKKQERDEDLRNWLKELQNIFYEIEDAMDEFKWNKLEQKGNDKKVRIPFSCSDPVAYKSQLARKMTKLCDHLDTVAVELYRFHLTEKNSKHLAYSRIDITHSFHSATEVSVRLMKPSWPLHYTLTSTPIFYNKGQYDDVLKDFRESSDKFFHIVGNAGMGKSTLAKFLYHDPDVIQQFPMRLWVCVREDFDTRRLIKEIFSYAISEADHDDLQEKQMLFHVKRYLRSKILLVFQDLLIENLDNLPMLMDVLGVAHIGSKIMVITQSEAVADALGLQKQYKPQSLPNINNALRLPEQNPETTRSETVANDTELSNVNNGQGLPEQDHVTNQTEAVLDATEPSNIKAVSTLPEQNPETARSETDANVTELSNVNNGQGLPKQNSKTTQIEKVADATEPSSVNNGQGLPEQNSVTAQSETVAEITEPSNVNNPQELSKKNLVTGHSEAATDATEPSDVINVMGHNEEHPATTQSEAPIHLLPPMINYAIFSLTQTVYKIRGLSEENSLSLFKKHAFKHAQNPELDEIAEQIVQKCEGLPLAIKCLGGLLSSKTRIAEWKNVNNRLRAQEDRDGSILPALRLCYDLMPSNLQRCFIHCSQLPNDSMFSSNDLIQMWMAHRLLHSVEEKNLSLENIGEKYFKELWERCFFQEMEEHGLGYWFKMHPLIRKLACIIAQEQAVSSGGLDPVTNIRFIAFQPRETVPPSEPLALKCISRFKCLRLLYLGNADLQEIPHAIGTLKYLRYLDLHGNKRIKRLPNSICDLQSLQTLILASCSELEELPSDIRNLISLRYLWVTTNKLKLQKNGIGVLNSLRFLAIGGCGIDDLHNLFERVECLAGLETLVIYNCRALKSLPDGIRFLKSLQNLVLWSCKKLTLTLENVEFKLQRFTIRDLPKVDQLPQWLEGSVETLRILDIINCPIVLDLQKMSTTYRANDRFFINGIVRIPRYAFGEPVLQEVNFRQLKKLVPFEKF